MHIPSTTSYGLTFLLTDNLYYPRVLHCLSDLVEHEPKFIEILKDEINLEKLWRFFFYPVASACKKTTSSHSLESKMILSQMIFSKAIQFYQNFNENFPESNFSGNQHVLYISLIHLGDLRKDTLIISYCAFLINLV